MTKALHIALRLLQRREHGAAELLMKLQQKGASFLEAEEALLECQRLGYQSDARFAEAFCRARVNQGYGPLRIKQELQAKQIDLSWIEEALAAEEAQWLSHGMKLLIKKGRFSAIPKQQQLLWTRGFPMDMVKRIIEELSDIPG